jgi:hypothetical protein
VHAVLGPQKHEQIKNQKWQIHHCIPDVIKVKQTISVPEINKWAGVNQQPPVLQFKLFRG